MEKALVVDNEPSILELTAVVIGKMGYEVVKASGGTEAIQALEGEVFDLVVTDFGLPGADGAKVAAAAKKHHPNTRVVMMTAYDPDLVGPKPGVDVCLRKPFGIRDLQSAISRLGEAEVAPAAKG